MAANKTQQTTASVDDFLNTVADEQKRTDSFRIKTMMAEITGKPAKMWGPGIVGFGTYHYKYDSGREGDFFRAGFSPRKNALTLYIMGGHKRHAELMAQLGKYKTGKGCLYIKKLEDIDGAILRELIAASVEYMAEQYPENA